MYVKNHSNLAEGLYKATTAIDTNGALSGKVSSANGELNTLSSAIALLKSRFISIPHGTTFEFPIGNYGSAIAILFVNNVGGGVFAITRFAQVCIYKENITGKINVNEDFSFNLSQDGVTMTCGEEFYGFALYMAA